MRLSEKTCVPCRGGVPPLGADDARKLLGEVPEWTLSQDATRIERRFKFRNFSAALAFVNRVGDLAEEQGHHPDIRFGWGYAAIELYTHKINGLHENDFVMAAKFDRLYDDLAATSA